MTTPAFRTVRERAAFALDVDAGASPQDVRAAFLQRLATDGFAPPEEAVWAANAAAQTALPLSEGAKAEAAATEGEIVERFAQEYWSLPAETRRERWTALSGELGDPEAKARMRELEEGLAYPVENHDNPMVQDVAAAIRELYVLKPREMVVRRTEWLIANRDRVADLKDAAKRLRSEQHAFNRLVPSLAVELARTPPLAIVEPLDPVFAEAEREERATREAKEADAAARRRARAEFAASQTASSSGGGGFGSGWPAYIVIGIVIFVLRACIAFNKSDTTMPSINYSPPSTPIFSYKEINDFLNYDNRPSHQKSKLNEPLRYQEWVNSGKATGFRR